MQQKEEAWLSLEGQITVNVLATEQISALEQGTRMQPSKLTLTVAGYQCSWNTVLDEWSICGLNPDTTVNEKANLW